MELSRPMQKFSKVDSSGQICMETQKNLCGIVQDAKNTGISIPETQCHRRAIFKWISSMFGELTSWVLSQCRSNANTSWWLWTTCPNGSKHFLVLRPTQGALGKCFRKLYFLVLEFQGSWSAMEAQLHRHNLQEVPQRARIRPSGCDTIPSPNKWSGRDV